MQRARAIAAAGALGLAGIVGAGAAWASPAPGGEPGVEPGGTEAGAEVSHAAEECIELLETGGEPDDCAEAPSPIVPATSELVWSIISFGLLLFLLSKFALPAVQKAMAGRTERIQANLDDAERVKAEASTVLAQYQAQLADARNESARIIEEARQTADQLRRDLMARAEAEVAELRQRTRDDIAAAQERATADLQAKVGALAIDMAEKVVAANLDREANRRLIEQFIAEAGRQRQ